MGGGDTELVFRFPLWENAVKARRKKARSERRAARRSGGGGKGKGKGKGKHKRQRQRV